MKRARKNTAFVLLIVLLVLVIAVTALAATARNSCRRAVQAGSDLRDLQLRWGALSCKALCLPAAELILGGENAGKDDGDGGENADTDQNHKPVAFVRRDITLGKIKFHLIISDEQAKANVNVLQARGGRAQLTEDLRALQSGLRHVLTPRLRPVKPATKEAKKKAAIAEVPILYRSFDQLFTVDHPSQLAGADGVGANGSVADRVTCWGDGKVNFLRADRSVLRQTLKGVLDETQIDKLIKLRAQQPDCTVMEAIATLELTEKQAEVLMPLLTDMSWCHSLWIIAEGASRSWYSLHILDAAASTGSSEISLKW